MEFEIKLPGWLGKIIIRNLQRRCKHDFLVAPYGGLRPLSSIDQGELYQIQCQKCKVNYIGHKGETD